PPGADRLAGAPAPAAARGAPGRLAAGGGTAADQGLPAPGRPGPGSAGLGPGLQHRRPAHADARGRVAAALPPAPAGSGPMKYPGLAVRDSVAAGGAGVLPLESGSTP